MLQVQNMSLSRIAHSNPRSNLEFFMAGFRPGEDSQVVSLKINKHEALSLTGLPVDRSYKPDSQAECRSD